MEWGRATIMGDPKNAITKATSGAESGNAACKMLTNDEIKERYFEQTKIKNNDPKVAA